MDKVVDQSGKVLYQAPTPSKQTIEADISHDVSYALQSVVEEGTGRIVAGFDHHVAGKTGTSGVGHGVTSAWFVAYTKQITTAVMFVAGIAATKILTATPVKGLPVSTVVITRLAPGSTICRRR